jgi:nitrogen regulatory protein PII 1
MLMIVAEDEKKDEIVHTVTQTCLSGKNGAYGDGKLFVLPVEREITISSYRKT